MQDQSFYHLIPLGKYTHELLDNGGDTAFYGLKRFIKDRLDKFSVHVPSTYLVIILSMKTQAACACSDGGPGLKLAEHMGGSSTLGTEIEIEEWIIGLKPGAHH